jgi:hypothetical protein
MTTMTTGPMEDGYLSDIPAELVVRAQQDTDFAVRLLNRETREYALGEAGLDLTEDELGRLHAALDYIARMSFQDVLQALKNVGATNMA